MSIERKKVEVNNEKCQKEIKQVLPLKAPAQETGAVAVRVHMQKEKARGNKQVVEKAAASFSLLFFILPKQLTKKQK
jgi:hypothetical protein